MYTFLSRFPKISSQFTPCYNRIILRGYILWMFSPGSLINFLRSMRFEKHTNGAVLLLPFYAEFYFNRHNVVKPAMDRKGIAYRKNANAFTMIEEEKRRCRALA